MGVEWESRESTENGFGSGSSYRMASQLECLENPNGREEVRPPHREGRDGNSLTSGLDAAGQPQQTAPLQSAGGGRDPVVPVAQSTVERYRVRPRRPPSPAWRAFLKAHGTELVALDFFTVPTVGFKVLFVLVLLAYARRKVIHFNVTAHPTAQWTARQLVEAFPWETAPKYLLRDRDAIYGGRFQRRVAHLGIETRLDLDPLQGPRARIGPGGPNSCGLPGSIGVGRTETRGTTTPHLFVPVMDWVDLPPLLGQNEFAGRSSRAEGDAPAKGIQFPPRPALADGRGGISGAAAGLRANVSDGAAPGTNPGLGG